MGIPEDEAFYKENRAGFVAAFLGKWVLIKDRRLVGVFETQRDALEEAARRFGLGPYVIKQVRDPEPVENL